MLSFKKGTPIAIINGGKYDQEIIHICNVDEVCCGACGPACRVAKRPEDRCCDDCNGGQCLINNNPLDVLSEDYIRSHKKKLTREEMKILKNAFDDGYMDEDEKGGELEDIFNAAMRKVKRESEQEFKIWDQGIVQPLVNFNETFRYYIAGPTGSGKSYYIGMLLKTMRKVCRNKKIFVFSDVDEDPALDSVKRITRLKLDDSLLDKKPINPVKLRDSVCVFDDIDSIQNKKLQDYVQKLRDSLLKRGRHENISVIVTAHLMSDYKNTRIIMNEAGAITFFPKSGATDGIKHVLKKYVGMTKTQIDKVFLLPSRWVTVFKNAPQYVMYDKGVYLL